MLLHGRGNGDGITLHCMVSVIVKALDGNDGIACVILILLLGFQA